MQFNETQSRQASKHSNSNNCKNGPKQKFTNSTSTCEAPNKKGSTVLQETKILPACQKSDSTICKNGPKKKPKNSTTACEVPKRKVSKRRKKNDEKANRKKFKKNVEESKMKQENVDDSVIINFY